MDDVTETLRRALSELLGERGKLDRQIASLRSVMGVGGAANTRATSVRRRRRRKPMSAAARAAVSRRMKAYWAKRRGAKKR